VMEAIEIARKAGFPLRIAAKMRAPDELRYFREVVEPALGPDEEFLGEIGDPEKYELMGGAFAFLNAIQWPEPFGLVMIEALATGTPVVGTPVGAAPEVVDHGTTGYLAPVHELAALLPRVASLNRTDCRASVEERFSSDRMLADHLALYAQIWAQRLPSGGQGRGALHENQVQDPQARGA
jgi:glycosyltransferase involved in cell wall biosynthesis